MLQRKRAAIERGEVDAALPLASELACEAARGEAGLLRAEVERSRALLAAPSIAAAQAELARAAALSGSERLLALSRTRRLLEAVTRARAEPVVLRASYLLPHLDPVETADVAGTSFAVSGVAALGRPGHALVIDGQSLVSYGPEPTTVVPHGARWPLVMTTHHLSIGSGTDARFADLTTAPAREVTRDARAFRVADGSQRTVEEHDKAIRLSLPSGDPVTLDARGSPVFIDDVAGRVVTYWPLAIDQAGPRPLELSVFDATDGRRIVRAANPPSDGLAVPQVSVSADGTRLVVTSSHTTSLLTIASGAWKTIGTYDLEILGGGAHTAAFTRDGSHLCAAWQDSFHVLPDDLPRSAHAVCVFEPRTPFHTDAHIGCVEREPGWVPTRSAARSVSVTGSAIASDVRKVVVLENAAGVNPLPGGLMPSPEVHVRLVIADADTCKIERRIDLGTRRLENHEAVAISADGSIVALSAEAFEVSSGKPTPWSAAGMPPKEARKARGSAAKTIAAFGLTNGSGRLEMAEGHGVVRVLDANRQLLATLIGSDPANRAAIFVDGSYRFEGDFQSAARCRVGAVLAPIEVCGSPRDAADVDTVLQRRRR